VWLELLWLWGTWILFRFLSLFLMLVLFFILLTSLSPLFFRAVRQSCVIRCLAVTVPDVCLKLGCFQSISTYSTLTYLVTYLQPAVRQIVEHHRWSTSLCSSTLTVDSLHLLPTRPGQLCVTAAAPLLGDLLPHPRRVPDVATPSSRSDQTRPTPASAPASTWPITWPDVTCSRPSVTSSNCA